MYLYLQGKLDGYKADMAKGKSLDGDRKAAIEKYNDVVVGLEVARDLVAQIKALSLEEAKKAKKASKKEQQEKYKAEIARVASTLEIQVKSRILKSSCLFGP